MIINGIIIIYNVFYFFGSDPSRIKSAMSSAANLTGLKTETVSHTILITSFDFCYITILLSNCKTIVFFLTIKHFCFVVFMSYSSTLSYSFIDICIVCALLPRSFLFHLWLSKKKHFLSGTKLDSFMNSQY